MYMYILCLYSYACTHTHTHTYIYIQKWFIFYLSIYVFIWQGVGAMQPKAGRFHAHFSETPGPGTYNVRSTRDRRGSKTAADSAQQVSKVCVSCVLYYLFLHSFFFFFFSNFLSFLFSFLFSSDFFPTPFILYISASVYNGADTFHHAMNSNVHVNTSVFTYLHVNLRPW